MVSATPAVQEAWKDVPFSLAPFEGSGEVDFGSEWLLSRCHGRSATFLCAVLVASTEPASLSARDTENARVHCVVVAKGCHDISSCFWPHLTAGDLPCCASDGARSIARLKT